jgi:seryl-tRNA(Sec) selenium transferase
MATVSPNVLRARAEAIVSTVGTADLISTVDTESVPGGGTLPTVSIPSVGLLVTGDHTSTLRDRARPIIARVDDRGTVLDLRTVAESDDDELVAALTDIVKHSAGAADSPAGSS